MRTLEMDAGPSETPRTKQCREIRERRLQYFHAAAPTVQSPLQRAKETLHDLAPTCPDNNKDMKSTSGKQTLQTKEEEVTKKFEHLHHIKQTGDYPFMKLGLPSTRSSDAFDKTDCNGDVTLVVDTPKLRTSEFKISLNNNDSGVRCHESRVGDYDVAINGGSPKLMDTIDDCSELGLSTHRHDNSTFRSEITDGTFQKSDPQFLTNLEQHISMVVQDNLDLSIDTEYTTNVITEDNTTLENVLGKDRLERLLQNLKDSDDESDSNYPDNVHEKKLESSLESPSKQFGWVPVQDSWVDGELGLQTHRPDSPKHNMLSGHNGNIHIQEGTQEKTLHQPDTDIGTRKYSFSVEDIYAEAEKLSLTEVDLDGHVENQPVSEACSSLIGREVVFQPRKHPFGPIPKPWQNVEESESSPKPLDAVDSETMATDVMQAPKTYTNPSIERYFSSLQELDHQDVKKFSSLLEKIDLEDKKFDESAVASIENSSTQEDEDNHPRISQPPASSSDPYRSPEKPSVNSWRKLEFENYLESVRSEIRKSIEDDENDDLYTRVTSVLSDVNEDNINTKLKKLGIDFDFLKGIETFDKFKAEVDEVKAAVQIQDDPVKAEPSKSIPKPVQAGNTPRQGSKQGKPPRGLGASIVRVCPECAEINTFSANWCDECDTSLACVKPVPSKLKSHNMRQSQNSSASSSAGLNKRHIANYGNGLDSVGSSDDSKAVNDSIEFVYEQSVRPSAHLPPAVSAELAINLRDSADSTYGGKSHLKTQQQLNDDVAEDIKFEYQEDVKGKNLSEAARMELSLNLRESQDSNFTGPSSSRGPSQNGNVALPDNSINEYHISSLGDGDNVASANDAQLNYRKLLGRLAVDPRSRNGEGDPNSLHPSSSISLPKPSQSRSRPSSKRGNKLNQSKMRMSVETEAYQRRWATSSSSWTSFAPGELSKPSSLQGHVNRNRPSSASVSRPNSTGLSASRKGLRPSSAQSQRYNNSGVPSYRLRPQSAGSYRSDAQQNEDREELGRHDSDPAAGNIVEEDSRNASVHRGRILRSSHPGGQLIDRVPEPPLVTGKTRSDSSSTLPLFTVASATRSAGPIPRSLTKVNEYHAKFFAKSKTQADQKSSKKDSSKTSPPLLPPIADMSPRIRTGDDSLMTCLPDEIVLMIFCYLSPRDLTRCALVSHDLHRVAMDVSLWKTVVMKKKMVKDDWLINIGARQPGSLSMIQCRGEDVTANGLRELFRQSGDTLQELNITGCSRGQFSGDNLLLHAGSRCRSISSLDVSWCNICDNALVGFSESCNRLEALCMNGCQMITDDALKTIFMKHGLYLRTLELFGCFHITSRAIAAIANHCKGLVTLNLGQCWKLSDTSISQLTASLGLVEHLDLRGCKQIKDSTTHQILRNCTRLHTLALANCPNITDASLAEIAVLGANIRSLDICGCKKVTNTGVKSLAQGACQIEYLDLSSTGISHQSVSALASYGNRYLEVLKVNFCKPISPNCLLKLAKHCKRLKKLYLYGVNGIREHNVHDMKALNADLWVEM